NAELASLDSGFLWLGSKRQRMRRGRSNHSASKRRNSPAKRVPEVYGHTNEHQNRSVRPNAVQHVNRAQRRIQLLIDQHHVRDHRRSEEHTSELQSPDHLVCRLLLEKKKQNHTQGKTQRQKDKYKTQLAAHRVT